MPPQIHAYLLVTTRSKQRVLDFLDEFVPERQALADAYELPQHAAGPEVVFESADELLAALEDRPAEGYALYWGSTRRTGPRGAIVAHTTDGKIVFGLSVDEDDEELAADFLARMESFFGGVCPGYLAWEEPPLDNAEEFLVREAVFRTAGRPLV